jgi:hypothetical protein
MGKTQAELWLYHFGKECGDSREERHIDDVLDRCNRNYPSFLAHIIYDGSRIGLQRTYNDGSKLNLYYDKPGQFFAEPARG